MAKVPDLMFPTGETLVPSLGGIDTQVSLQSPLSDASVVEDGADLFDGLGLDLKGFGTIASLVGGFMAHSDDKKYKEGLLKREDERIERDRVRQDKFEGGMREAWN